MESLLRIPDLKSKFGVRDRAILELIYSSGLRISEVANCKISQLDFMAKADLPVLANWILWGN